MYSFGITSTKDRIKRLESRLNRMDNSNKYRIRYDEGDKYFYLERLDRVNNIWNQVMRCMFYGDELVKQRPVRFLSYHQTYNYLKDHIWHNI